MTPMVTIEQPNGEVERLDNMLSDLDAKVLDLKNREAKLAEEREQHLLPAVYDSEARTKLRNINEQLKWIRIEQRDYTAAREQAVAKRADIEAEQKRIAGEARRARIATIADRIATHARNVDEALSAAARGFIAINAGVDELAAEGVAGKLINPILARGARTRAAASFGLHQHLELPAGQPGLRESMTDAIAGWLRRIQAEG